jgi:two-component system cell cycle response regulator
MIHRVPNHGNQSTPCLVQYSGAKIGKRFNLKSGENIIGQKMGLIVTLPETSVAETHARLLVNKHDCMIEDLTGNGSTFVNEAVVQTTQILRDGDILRVGQIMLKFFQDGLGA